MKIREIIDHDLGKKWEIYKKSQDEYFYKYYEFYSSCGWKYLWQEGGHNQWYYSRDAIEWEFGIKL